MTINCRLRISPWLFAAACFVSLPGQASDAVRYPWDKRPKTCPVADVTAPGECNQISFPDRDLAKARLRLLYYTEQFGLLERGLEELDKSKAVSDTGMPLRTGVYDSIFGLFGFAKVPEEHHTARLNRWDEAIPASRFQPIASAIFLKDRAWNLRGGGYAHTVSEETWALFDERFKQGEKVLLAAPQSSRELPAWHMAMLMVTQNLKSPRSSVDDVFMNAVTRWPDYLPFYTLMAARLTPKWGGNWRALEKFAAQWSDVLAEKKGEILYARIYIDMFGAAYSLAEMQADWPRLKKSFAHLIATTKSPYFKNYLASIACAARDKETFQKAFAEIGPGELKDADWIRGHSAEACKTWAFSAT